MNFKDLTKYDVGSRATVEDDHGLIVSGYVVDIIDTVQHSYNGAGDRHSDKIRVVHMTGHLTEGGAHSIISFGGFYPREEK